MSYSHEIYVGTYAKYNAGSLKGEWLDLSDYSDKDEFLEACYELHSDEQDPELMTQDVSSELFYDELKEDPGSIDPDWFDIVQLDDEKQEIIAAFLDAFSYPLSRWDEYENYYIGEFEDEKDYGQSCLDMSGYPEHLKWYIDLELYAKDMMESVLTSGTHYFQAN
jgi:antirestriction protein